jgi:hypothetical protein
MEDSFMLRKPEVANILLWIIAIFTTFLMVKDSGVFTYLGPVYAICMIGSVVTVKKALQNKK